MNALEESTIAVALERAEYAGALLEERAELADKEDAAHVGRCGSDMLASDAYAAIRDAIHELRKAQRLHQVAEEMELARTEPAKSERRIA